ncbi:MULTISPECIES: triose-phosphate isomerase family protein [unclassified Nonomuraea]|uniref:triose-phosphate isomerase n=1 Tax=unclassified Nonomuraea TaxID=2593643 RepID=UPI0033EF1298
MSTFKGKGPNTKMRLGMHGLRSWISSLLQESDRLAAVGLFVLGPYPALGQIDRLLAGTGLTYGAQNLWPDAPECTGEVSAGLLAELGCAYVMVGHADRRRVFGEDDALIAAKAESAARAGLVPVLCVGESRPGSRPEVTHVVIAQVEPVLRQLPPDAALAVMYEPAWTIGGDRAADPADVAAVFDAVTRQTAHRAGPTRLLYGGAVTPGVFTRLASTVRLDGIGLGRAAYDTDMRRRILDEVLERR